MARRRIERIKERGRFSAGEIKGLSLQVSASGARSWVLRFQLNKRVRYMGLGSADTFGVVEARARARKFRQLLADGIDPIEARKAERAKQAQATARRLTFKQAAERYFEGNNDGWSSRSHAEQFTASLRTYAYPLIGATAVDEVDTAAVLRVMEQKVPVTKGHPSGRFWNARTITASRVLRRIALVLDWSTVRGYRTGDNPARWKGHLDQVLPAVEKVAQRTNHTALAYTEVPELMSKLRTHGSIAARPLAFLILTACRRNEVVGAKWNEIDFNENLWSVPAARMKGRREHRIPLSPQMIKLLQSAPREAGNDFVFTGNRPGTSVSPMALQLCLEQLGYGDLATVHGFRSSFRDWGSEQTNFSRELLEHALAHVVGGKTEQAYARGTMFEKRRKLMQAWSTYCTTPQRSGADTGPIRRPT